MAGKNMNLNSVILENILKFLNYTNCFRNLVPLEAAIKHRQLGIGIILQFTHIINNTSCKLMLSNALYLSWKNFTLFIL